jgi:hypothetical protein
MPIVNESDIYMASMISNIECRLCPGEPVSASDVHWLYAMLNVLYPFWQVSKDDEAMLAMPLPESKEHPNA